MEFRQKFLKNQFIDTNDTNNRCPEGFFLGDNNGGYLWFGKKRSRYQGWYIMPPKMAGKTLIKILDSIDLCHNNPVSEILDNRTTILRRRGDFEEEVFLPDGGGVLCWQANQISEIALIFDIKDSYADIQEERHYEIIADGRKVLIHFFQENGFSLGEIFVALIFDSANFTINQQWIKQEYEYDRIRGSAPYFRWVLRAICARTRQLVIAAGTDKSEVLKQANFTFDHFAQIKKQNIINSQHSEQKYRRYLGISAPKSNAVFAKADAAAIRSAQALRSLVVFEKKQPLGLFAGLPWFFQFWRRDEAVSLQGLSLIKPSLAQKILLKRTDELEENNLNDIAADAVGWLFLRLENYVDALNNKEKSQLEQLAERVILYCLMNQTENDFAANGAKQTWMDSIDRSGARIEMQALRLKIYNLAGRLSTSTIKREFWQRLEAKLLLKTRQYFFNNETAFDGIDPQTGKPDPVARPNVFLAAYIYPQLLSKNEWIKYFDKLLPKLWLNWGGLSTVDTADDLFHPVYSGEFPASYHNGDSWFYINNIAAIAMHRLDPLKYHSFVNKIFDAGVDNVLFGQAAGAGSELSSANKFAPAGCFNQAWTNATFLELFEALGHNFIFNKKIFV